jgi:hypothetical protein
LPIGHGYITHPDICLERRNASESNPFLYAALFGHRGFGDGQATSEAGTILPLLLFDNATHTYAEPSDYKLESFRMSLSMIFPKATKSAKSLKTASKTKLCMSAFWRLPAS